MRETDSWTQVKHMEEIELRQGVNKERYTWKETKHSVQNPNKQIKDQLIQIKWTGHTHIFCFSNI